jgi:hypothetical protein
LRWQQRKQPAADQPNYSVDQLSAYVTGCEHKGDFDRYRRERLDQRRGNLDVRAQRQLRLVRSIDQRGQHGDNGIYRAECGKDGYGYSYLGDRYHQVGECEHHDHNHAAADCGDAESDAHFDANGWEGCFQRDRQQR